MALLTVKNLKTFFDTDYGLVKAVDDVSFQINEKETVGFVGESGCGKSATMLSTMRLINPPGRIVGGEIIFDGKDLLQYPGYGSEMRAIRGRKISIVFQDPVASLNPTLTVFQQLSEMLKFHLRMDSSARRKRCIELFEQVGIQDADRRLDDYPHQFVGGMRQRITIAMGLSCNPEILIADEPTTALDATTQLQILELMQDLIKQYAASLVIVTHNLGVVARYVDRIYVMYAGRIIESGTSDDIFSQPKHPYTIGLLKSVPRLDDPKEKKLMTINGAPPSLINLPPTCAFLPRCPYGIDKCREQPSPPLRPVGENHHIRCYVDL